MKNIKFFITAFIVFLLDRGSKILILNKQVVYYPVIKNCLSICSVANTGAAFSLFQGQQIFLIFVSSLVVIFLLFYFYKKNVNIFLQISWGLLLGGALGNLFDRLFYRCVVDFISLECFNFPVFNFADLAISLSAVLLFYHYLIKEGGKNA